MTKVSLKILQSDTEPKKCKNCKYSVVKKNNTYYGVMLTHTCLKNKKFIYTDTNYCDGYESK